MKFEVSIVIPIKDKTDLYIKQCLTSLEKQDYSGTFEVLVISGGNIAQARNFGIAQAKGEIVAFIDSDCVAPDNWLTMLVTNLKAVPSVGGLGGTNYSPVNGPYLGHAIDFIYSSYLGSLNSTSLRGPKSPKYVSSLACINSAFWRSVLNEVGGFDEEFDLCEDTNLSFKVRAAGYNLLFNPKIFVWHYRRDTLKRFSKQFFLYGMAESRSILTNTKYAARGVIIFFALALSFPFIVYFSPLISLLIAGAYFAVVFSVGAYATIQAKKINLFFLVPGLFLIQHFSYLFGMICGLTKGKWKRTKRQCSIFRHFVKSTNDSR